MLTSTTPLYHPPGFQHLIERAVVHECAAVHFLLNQAVVVGGVEKLLDVFKIHSAGRKQRGAILKSIVRCGLCNDAGNIYSALLK